MDQDPCLTEGSRQPPGDESVLAVASRRGALDRLRAAVEAGPASPILITGEPGAGKTWLTRQLSYVLPPRWLSVCVDLTRATDALAFVQWIGHSLGIRFSESLGSARTRLHAFLQDEAVDGRRWLLIVDESHRAAPVVWDEIKAMVNQSGRPGGFAAIVILADTELVRAFGTRDFRGFLPHLGAHLHLAPLDLDEARELLGFIGYEFDQDDRELEELHRDARGNPRGLLRLAGSWPAHGWMRPAIGAHGGLGAVERASTQHVPNTLNGRNLGENEGPRYHPPDPAPITTPAHGMSAGMDPSILIPSKPPLRVEEGLVEVGWDGDLENESNEVQYTAIVPERLAPGDSSFNEELIEDRYAALQAWTEWTKIQEKASGRGVATEASPSRAAAETEPTQSDELSSAESPGSFAPTPAGATSGVRAEPQHDFAPYSQLFTRLRQSKQP
jgi:hypothetical protein